MHLAKCLLRKSAFSGEYAYFIGDTVSGVLPKNCCYPVGVVADNSVMGYIECYPTKLGEDIVMLPDTTFAKVDTILKVPNIE